MIAKVMRTKTRPTEWELWHSSRDLEADEDRPNVFCSLTTDRRTSGVRLHLQTQWIHRTGTVRWLKPCGVADGGPAYPRSAAHALKPLALREDTYFFNRITSFWAAQLLQVFFPDPPAQGRFRSRLPSGAPGECAEVARGSPWLLEAISAGPLSATGTQSPATATP